MSDTVSSGSSDKSVDVTVARQQLRAAITAALRGEEPDFTGGLQLVDLIHLVYEYAITTQSMSLSLLLLFFVAHAID